mmetsp:Transcript_5352/g.33543  ORF Transcript_5352/g.33543 Transcript_5352/m.33543 type:complete len:86 (+) Transcript_5352:192-449(+)
MERIRSRVWDWKVTSFMEDHEGSTNVDSNRQRLGASFVPFVCFHFMSQERDLAKELRSYFHRVRLLEMMFLHPNENARVPFIPPL